MRFRCSTLTGRSLLLSAAACLAFLVMVETALAIDQSFPAAGQCEWPSSVQLSMRPAEGHPAELDSDSWYRCSGVYVGNERVLTAAHCVDHMDTVNITFGEHADSPDFTLLSASCTTHLDAVYVFGSISTSCGEPGTWLTSSGNGGGCCWVRRTPES